MSERLERLAARLGGIAAPGDPLAAAHLSLAKAQGALLVQIAEMGGDLTQKREVLTTAWGTIDTMARTVGENNEQVKILRAMHAIASAMIEGEEEPTDEELGLD